MNKNKNIQHILTEGNIRKKKAKLNSTFFQRKIAIKTLFKIFKVKTKDKIKTKRLTLNYDSLVKTFNNYT